MEDQNDTVNTIDAALSTDPSIETPVADEETSTNIAADIDAPPLQESSIDQELVKESADQGQIRLGEDSQVADSMKAEAVDAEQNDSPTEEWRTKLQSFHDVTNGQLAAKENFKLVCVDKKTKQAFAKNFTIEANRSFQLTVNLRRRLNGTKLGGKSVA